MEYPVYLTEKMVGTITILENNSGFEFTVHCPFTTLDILRCYGLRKAEQPLLIGVLEPKSGELFLTRRLSKLSLGGSLPTQFILLNASQSPINLFPTEYAESPPITSNDLPENQSTTPQLTGDPLLDNLLKQKKLYIQTTNDTISVACPFDPQKEFVLAFAACCCTLKTLNGTQYAYLTLTPAPNLNPKKTPAS